MTGKALAKQEPDDTRGLGVAMKALTPKHRRFVVSYCENLEKHGRLAAAARAAGYGLASEPATVAVIAQQIAHRDDVIAAIKEYSAKQLRQLAPDAVQTVTQILKDPLHKDRLKAANVVLSRADPEIQKVETTVEITGDHKRDALEHLKHLKSIGATREMLEKEFGFSGLGYYEDLLAKDEAAKLPVVDAEFTEIEPEIDWANEGPTK
jgi:phage terminase small subunit